MLYIGIDLGTSAVKLLLMDGAGQIFPIAIGFARPSAIDHGPSLSDTWPTPLTSTKLP